MVTRKELSGPTSDVDRVGDGGDAFFLALARFFSFVGVSKCVGQVAREPTLSSVAAVTLRRRASEPADLGLPAGRRFDPSELEVAEVAEVTEVNESLELARLSRGRRPGE